MMKRRLHASLILLFLCVSVPAQGTDTIPGPRATTRNGVLEGVYDSGIRIFMGVPYAAPPVGELRWKEPQPPQDWTGVRKAVSFGPRAMQPPIFSDMRFRSNGMSEDCLYLNIWTPARADAERFPVLVYFYGGGFVAGDGSEYRYDGASMARRGIVSVTVNYRLGVFGFLAHPDLTKESPHHASGNYGLLDQAAALHWVRQNIAAFGGDPARVTIAGESAGSISVSAQMVSPLSKDLIAGAIGESGSVLGTMPLVPLAAAEESGIEFARALGAVSLAALRALPAEEVLARAVRMNPFRFSLTIDGYFFPKDPRALFDEGKQAHIPLLVGWNSQEMDPRALMGPEPMTVAGFERAVQRLYGNDATAILKLYAPASEQEVESAARDLAGDRFIGFSTWKWSDVHRRTGGKPVYRYYYERPRPSARQEKGGGAGPSAPAGGASHSAEIEYALGNLSTNRVYDWQPEDFKVSEIMQGFFASFVKSGDPSDTGVPFWPPIQPGSPAVIKHIDVDTHEVTETSEARGRYLLLERLGQAK